MHMGWGAVRGACGAAVDGRKVVVGSRCRALALVPVWGARGGREIATVRAPRQLRGGSRRVGAGPGVLAGCLSAGQGGTGASQGPQWSLPRANMRAGDALNLGDTIEIVYVVRVMASGPSVSRRAP